MHFGFGLDSSDIDLWNIYLLNAHLDLQDTDIASKYFVCFQDMSSKCLQDMSSRCLQDIYSRRLEDVFKTCLVNVCWEPMFFMLALKWNLCE